MRTGLPLNVPMICTFPCCRVPNAVFTALSNYPAYFFRVGIFVDCPPSSRTKIWQAVRAIRHDIAGKAVPKNSFHDEVLITCRTTNPIAAEQLPLDLVQRSLATTRGQVAFLSL